MSRPRVLVVDDDAAHRRAVARVLGDRCDVAAVASAGVALERAAVERFDLALLDIRMPGMDGFDLMGELKVQDSDLDVILMTGSITDTDERLTRAIRENAFFFLQKPFHRDVLLALVSRCLDLRRLAAEKRTQASQMQKELQAARSFQESLLPGRHVRSGALTAEAIYEASRAIGGDIFDWEPLDDGGLALLVADVAGKGAAAAMLTGMVKQAWRSSAHDGFAPGVALQRVFTATRLFPDHRHLTAFSGRFDSKRGTLEYIISAGHPPAMVRRKDGDVEWLEPNADILHPSFPSWRFVQSVTDFDPGDRVLVFTDGLLESVRAADGEMFGVERAEAALRDAPAGDPERIAESVREALRRHQEGRPADDDLALVVVGRD